MSKKSPLWTERDLYALMELDVRRVTGLTVPIDFPRLRMQGRGMSLEEIYADLSERVMGVDVRPLAAVERRYRERLAPLLATCGRVDVRRHSHEALRFLGYRAMQAVAALEPDWQGVAGKFGMYLLSNALWLAEEMRRGGLDRLVFLARDGRLIKEAFDAVNAVLHVPVETDYVRVSRSAVFPLQFRKKEDLLTLPLLVDVSAHTVRSLLGLFAPVIDREQAEAAMQDAGIVLDAPLDDALVCRFLAVFRERVFDAERFGAYRADAKAYFTPCFTGKCATFDVGYNLRSESVIADVTGADITAFITHIDSDLPDRRGLPYRTLYPASPYVSWVAREQFLLTMGDPLCLRYGKEGPVLGAGADVPVQMQTIQRRAMDFVLRMVELFGEDLVRMPVRPVDGCRPFEAYLHRTSRRQMMRLGGTNVENAFHDGAGEADRTLLQWQLMQTDCRAALSGKPAFATKMRRAFIRLREDPRGFYAKLKRR